jgi:hypothetical protein
MLALEAVGNPVAKERADGGRASGLLGCFPTNQEAEDLAIAYEKMGI